MPGFYFGKAARLCGAAAGLGLALQNLVCSPPAVAYDVSAYDLGYAARAAEICAEMDLIEVPDPGLRGDAEFTKGTKAVDENLSALGLEKACRFARRLYDSEEGKVAPLLKSR